MAARAAWLPFRKSPKDLYWLQGSEAVVEVRVQPVHAGRLVREDQHLGN